MAVCGVHYLPFIIIITFLRALIYRRGHITAGPRLGLVLQALPSSAFQRRGPRCCLRFSRFHVLGETLPSESQNSSDGAERGVGAPSASRHGGNRPARPPLRQRLKGGTKDRAEAVNGRAAAARPPPALRPHRLAGGPAAAPNGDGQRRGARQWGPAGGGGGGRRGRRPVEWGVQRGASRGGPLPCLPEARGAVLSAAPRSAPLV